MYPLQFPLFKTSTLPAVVLGILTALAFIIIDFYYALRDVIADVYLLDGIVEIVFLSGWLLLLARREKYDHHRGS